MVDQIHDELHRRITDRLMPAGERIVIDQIERFAPGFRAVVRRRIETSAAELEAWNPNLVGGDIAGGAR